MPKDLGHGLDVAVFVAIGIEGQPIERCAIGAVHIEAGWHGEHSDRAPRHRRFFGACAEPEIEAAPTRRSMRARKASQVCMCSGSVIDCQTRSTVCGNSRSNRIVAR